MLELFGSNILLATNYSKPFIFLTVEDELLGLAEDLNADSVFKNHDLNMDVLYRTGHFYVHSSPTFNKHEMEDGQRAKGRGRPKKTIHEVVKRDLHVNGLSVDMIHDRAQWRRSLGSLSSHGTLYKEITSSPSDVVTWTGKVSTQASESQRKICFYKDCMRKRKI
ncbi:Protein misato like [Arachis hypogaea]|nr:Protein misato like [Arachis hypogaea]